MDGLQKLKKDTFNEAKTCALSVTDDSNAEIGQLVPIGKWALLDDELLSSFADWRQRFMRFFLTQFSASKGSTMGYLENLSIKQSNRIFFAIFADNVLTGHIGLSNINENEAELDNIIRGVSGSHKDLMYFSEKALLHWAFHNLGVGKINAQVMSKNVMAYALHERLGFTLRDRYPLRKRIEDSVVIYEKCEATDATETFYLDIIEVSKCQFQQIL